MGSPFLQGKGYQIMTRFFTVNGKRYTAKPFDFNTICDLEDNGVSLNEMQSKPMSMVRAYFALCFGGNKDAAGKEIQAHIIAGGDFSELYGVMGEEMSESDFFQALSKKENEETPEIQNQTEKKTK